MQDSLVRNEYKPEEILNAVHYHKGILWEKIASFKDHLSSLDGAATHELGKPQEEMVFTKVGTQRIFFIHEDTKWVCVYKTDATNVEDAEKEIYANNYKQLPKKIINKAIQLCQE